MTSYDAVRRPPAVVCPRCHLPLDAPSASCPACGAPVLGPDALDAVRAIDRDLHQLAQRQAWLLDERARWLQLPAAPPAAVTAPATAALPAPPRPPVTAPAPPAPPPVAPWAPAPPAAIPPALPPPPAPPWSAGRSRREVHPLTARNVLLGLGVSLLALAALVFAVVAWPRLDDTGRAAVLAGVTAVVGVGALALADRLRATAEALHLLFTGLLLVDWYALSRAGVGAGWSWSAWWAVGTLAVGLLALGSGWWRGLRSPTFTAPALLMASGVLASLAFEEPAAQAAALGVLAAAVTGALASAWERIPAGPRAVTIAGGVLTQTLALLLVGAALLSTGGGPGAAAAVGAWSLPFLVLAVVAGDRMPTATATVVTAGGALVALAVPSVLATPRLDGWELVLLTMVVGTGALATARWCRGWAGDGLAVAGALTAGAAAVAPAALAVATIVAPLSAAATHVVGPATDAAADRLGARTLTGAAPAAAAGWAAAALALLAAAVALIASPARPLGGRARATGRTGQPLVRLVATLSGAGALVLAVMAAGSSVLVLTVVAGGAGAALLLTRGRWAVHPTWVAATGAGALWSVAIAWSATVTGGWLLAAVLAALTATLVVVAVTDAPHRLPAAGTAAVAGLAAVAAGASAAGWRPGNQLVAVLVTGALLALVAPVLDDRRVRALLVGIGSTASVLAVLGLVATWADTPWTVVAGVAVTTVLAGTSAAGVADPDVRQLLTAGTTALIGLTAGLALAAGQVPPSPLALTVTAVGAVLLVASAWAPGRRPEAAAAALGATTVLGAGLLLAWAPAAMLASGGETTRWPWAGALGSVIAAVALVGSAVPRTLAPPTRATAAAVGAGLAVIAGAEATGVALAPAPGPTPWVIAAAGGAALVLLAAHLLRPPFTVPIEAVGLGALVAGGLGVAGDLTDLAVVLTFAAATFAVAGLGERNQTAYRWAAPVAALAATWAWLATAGVTLPEAYTLPAAAVLLVSGWVLRQQPPFEHSWLAYGPGLVVAVVPSLLLAVTGTDPWRPIILLAVGAALVIVGVVTRTQAPLGTGAVTLLALAVDTLWPVAAQLPRWVVLGAAGVASLWLGATIERRLRQVHHWRDLAGHLR